MEKTDSDLKEGKCPLHPTKELEIREEENYFFKFSAFQDQLLDLYEKNPKFIKPAGKQKEITNFVKQGLQDFSISRLKEKMPWGVAVPNDDDHVMYVWFDALVNYISTLGWPEDQENFKKYWPVVQLAGKDNLRQQSAMWQAMLMAAKLPNSKKILINGFIGVDGQKMSKSLGNVIAPSELVEKYGIDGARYLIINLGVFGEDMDVTWKRLDETYTADLANGLGNLCSRVAKLCEQRVVGGNSMSEINNNFAKLMDNYDLTDGLKWISEQIIAADKFMSETTPWKKEGDEQKEILVEAINRIQLIAYHLQPFMPETTEKILKHFSQSRISAIEPLFPRLD